MEKPAMMSTAKPDQLAELIRTSFPAEPLPSAFWKEGTKRPVGDIPDELANRLALRSWVDVTLYDWTMIGHVSPIRGYLHPDAFRYYLPSLLVGVIQDISYLDWALESLLPSGQKRRAGRPEWMNFWESFSEKQRDAIRLYLIGTRLMLGDSASPIAQHLFDQLEAIWGRL